MRHQSAKVRAIRHGQCASSSGFAAGGGNDIVAPLMGPWLTERLGQPFAYLAYKVEGFAEVATPLAEPVNGDLERA